MSLDSVFTVPGVMLNPIPSGLVSHQDKIQICDQYNGIPISEPTVPGAKTLWIKERVTTTVWETEIEISSIWVKENKSTCKFVPETEVPTVN